MNTELFIARRLFADKENKQRLSRKIINIALAGISLGLTVMLIATAVVTGFKNEVTQKVAGFGSHIQIVNFDSNNTYETIPVNRDQPFLQKLHNIQNINHIQPFATKPGIIKTDEHIQGVVVKGVDTLFRWDFFKKHLIDGNLPDFSSPARSNEVLVSENLCRMIGANTGETLFMFFVNENEVVPRIRQFRIAGIFNTGLQEFDDLFVIADLRQVQHINGWSEEQISGFELLTRSFRDLDLTEMQVREAIVNYSAEPGSILRAISIKRKYPQIFDWLSILDMNVWVILILMLMVAGFNMISAMLVLILERSAMIGILKAIGGTSANIRRIFLYLAGFLLSRGLFWGNLIGLSLLALQKYLKVMKLDPASYYMEHVPVYLPLISIILLNAGALLVTLAMLVFPGYLISRISPDKIMRFD